MYNVYAIFDSCSGIFGDPFTAVNDAVAKRFFDDAVSNPNVPKYVRDDSVLYGLGFYDNKTGLFSSDVPPYVVSRGSSVIVPVSSDETSDTPALSEVTHSEA